jgi:hypothetical protein
LESRNSSFKVSREQGSVSFSPQFFPVFNFNYFAKVGDLLGVKKEIFLFDDSTDGRGRNGF